SSEVYAETAPSLFASRIPIAGIAGDQQAALFGQMCLRPGMLKHTYGTGGFMVLNTGDTPIDSSNNLLTTIAWKIDGKVTYVLEAMEADSKIPIKELRVDGGATVNDMLMQFQADLLNVPLVRPKTHETTALGAAYLAGLAVGFWKDTGELEQQWQSQKEFRPS